MEKIQIESNNFVFFLFNSFVSRFIQPMSSNGAADVVAASDIINCRVPTGFSSVNNFFVKKKFISTNFGELKAKRKMLLKIAAKHKQKHNE